MRVHHCAGCGSVDAKLSTLSEVRFSWDALHKDAVYNGGRSHPQSEVARCRASAKASERYLPAEAFLSDGKTLREGWDGTAR